MKNIILVLASMMLAVSSYAKVTFPSVLGDNMVLQRNTQVKLWGKATPHSKVSVLTSWNGEKYVTDSDQEGKWILQVETGEAGGPYQITVDDGSPAVLRNILLGEVWICGGQSNMEIPLSGFQTQPIENSAEVITYSKENKGIRLFTVEKTGGSLVPLEDCTGEWKISEPASVARFSAIGYLYGQILHRVLEGVPVGLISANWGGSNIETWMTVDKINSTEGVSRKVEQPTDCDNDLPQSLFNSMIWPIRNYTAKGFIWYQGEANRRNWFDYKVMMKSLVSLWREIWENEEMPFYCAQLAPYAYGDPKSRELALVIEAQTQAIAEIPHSGIAATQDVGNKTCIHPGKKLPVAERLAWLALANDYGIKGLPAPAPTYQSMKIEGNQIEISFNHVPDSENWMDPNSFVRYTNEGEIFPQGFEIAGEDGIFHEAEGRVLQLTNKIVVWSDEVPAPVAVRYAFCNYSEKANVHTTYGQPLIPFRTDQWEVKDILIGED